VIEEAKAKVSVEELAEHLGTKLRRSGKDLRGRCPIHGGKNPTSFAVEPEKQVWFCYSCLRGGDVIELARYAWNYDKSEVAMAAANLLHEFGHEIPPRRASWYRKQRRQKPIRDAIQEAEIHSLQKRIYRIFGPMVEGVEDAAEQREEARYFWDVAEQIAVLAWAGRRSA
jgi:DNA primase